MSEPSRDEYQPRTPERLIEVLNALDPNPRSVYWEAARTIERLLAAKPERERVILPSVHPEKCSCCKGKLHLNRVAYTCDQQSSEEFHIDDVLRALKGDPA